MVARRITALMKVPRVFIHSAVKPSVNSSFDPTDKEDTVQLNITGK